MSEQSEQTVEGMVFDLLLYGADRGALVGLEESGECTVSVLMLSLKAERSLGAALQKLVLRMGTSEVQQQPALNPAGSLAQLTNTARQMPHKWFWWPFWVGKQQVLAVVIHGRDACEKAAEICNAHRCPCSLDPKTSAPGYEVTDRRTGHILPMCPVANN
jgi:hypothetical protein